MTEKLFLHENACHQFVGSCATTVFSLSCSNTASFVCVCMRGGFLHDECYRAWNRASWSILMWSVAQTNMVRCLPLAFACWLWVSLVSWVFVAMRLTWFQLGVPENNTAASALSASWSSASGWTAGGLEFLCWPEDRWLPCPSCLLLTTQRCRPCGWRSSCCAFWHVRLWHGHGRRAWPKMGRKQGCFRNAWGCLKSVCHTLL